VAAGVLSATAVAHQAEADKADLGGVLLISANIAEMVRRENRQPFFTVYSQPAE
jgi:hypothetical protein